MLPRQGEVTRRRLDPAGQEQGDGPLAGRVEPGRRVQGGHDPLGATAVAEDDPGPAEPGGEVEGPQRVVPDAPREGRVDVRALGAGEPEVLVLVGAAYAGRGARREVGVPAGVRLERHLGLSRFGHRLQRERPDAVQQPVARSAVGTRVVVEGDQRAGDEPVHHVDRRGGRHAERLEDELHCRQRRTAGERRQRPQAPLVVGEQELVAPPDGRSQRPAALGPPAAGVLQDAEPVVEAPGDLLDGQGPGARRRELDGQRQAVEGPAQVEHALVVARRAGEPRGATSEQLDRVGQLEGRELDHAFPVDLERELAGAQDAQGRGVVEQPDREVGGHLHDVLAVVEDHEGGADPEPFEEGRLTAGSVQRRDEYVDHVRAGHRVLQPGQPDGVDRVRCQQPPADVEGDRGLADPARTDHLDQPLPRQQLGQRLHVGVAADQSGRHRREVAPRSAGPVGRCRHRTRRDLLRKDVPLQPLESRPGVEAELVTQLGPDALVGGQRVGLPPGPVERRDEQLPQALMERVLRDRALELADHAARPTELEPRPEPDLEQGGVGLVDAGARNARPLGVACHQERRSPEQPQRRAAQVRRLLGLATLPKARCGRGGPLHREHIHVVRLDLERVATVAAGEGRRSEGAPEHRDLGLQRVAPDLGGRRRPQVLDQALGAHELTGFEGEPRQQLRRLAARHFDLRAVDPDLQGSQQRDVQHPTRLGRVLGRPDVSSR